MNMAFAGYTYLFTSILLAVLSNILFRSQVSQFPRLPPEFLEKIFVLSVHVLTSPLLLVGMFLTFLGGINWLLALTKFELSFAFPFTALSYLLILLFDVIFFNSSFTASKFLGTVLILFGLFFLVK